MSTDTLTLEQQAQRKANHSGVEWYVVGKGGRQALVRCDEFKYLQANDGTYWRIDFVAFPKKTEVE